MGHIRDDSQEAPTARSQTQVILRFAIAAALGLVYKGSTMARPRKPNALRPVSTNVDASEEDQIDILSARYRKTRAAMVRILILDALKRETFTKAELEAKAAERALKAEREGVSVAPFDGVVDLSELQRRWRDDDAPSASTGRRSA